MGENENLIVELYRKSATSAVNVLFSGLDVQNYLLVRAIADLSLVEKTGLEGTKCDGVKKAKEDLQGLYGDIKIIQEKLLTVAKKLNDTTTSI